MLSHCNKSFIFDILITGGVGDFLAIESFFSQKEENIRYVYYATRAQKEISELFDVLPNYNIQHINYFDRFSRKLPTIWDINHLNRITRSKLDPAIHDYSIKVKFNEIRRNQYKHHNGSSFLKYELVKDIKSKFNLPSNYIVVHPCSRASYRRAARRELTPFEWKFLLAEMPGRSSCGKTGLFKDTLGGGDFRLLGGTSQQKIVVLNTWPDYQMPNNKNIIDLTNKTTLIESIEILKNSNGYFGIDSALSVLAAKLFGSEKLYIRHFGRSRKFHLWRNTDVYYYPHKSLEFLHGINGVN